MEVKLPEAPMVQRNVRTALAEWLHADPGGPDDEVLGYSMNRDAWQELWRYITACENLIENTRVRGKP